jgi:hypothetical protein
LDRVFNIKAIERVKALKEYIGPFFIRDSHATLNKLNAFFEFEVSINNITSYIERRHRTAKLQLDKQ